MAIENARIFSPSIILASASPRRKELLSSLGLPFQVVPSQVPEEADPALQPLQWARILAEEKAQAVGSRYPGALTIGCDTVVARDGNVQDKPRHAEDARSMLRYLRGGWHQVITAVAVLHPAGGRSESGVAITRVRMGGYTDHDIDRYIASGEPMDKAGGYGIQGLGGRLVEEIEGCYNNVVGLPLCETAKLLERFGVCRSPEPVCLLPSGLPCPRLRAVSGEMET
jgi:septum formation protein